MIDTFRLQRVQYVPKALEPGILYVAEDFDVAVHLCACGCGSKVTTPLGPTEWKVTERNGLPTLRPSVGNWQLPCRSHYLMSAGRTEWAGQWSEAQILAGRKAEQARREAYYAGKTTAQGFWGRIMNWAKGFLFR